MVEALSVTENNRMRFNRSLSNTIERNPQLLSNIEDIASQLDQEFLGKPPISQVNKKEPHFVDITLAESSIADYRAVYWEGTQTERFHQMRDVGFFLLPGASGTAQANTIEPQTFLKQARDFSVGIAASLSSSVSLDTVNQPLGTMSERAAEQAVLITELIKEHPVKEVFLVGHSLAGMEGAYVARALELAFESSGLSTTKIAGLILSQPGGHFDLPRKQIRRLVTERLPRFLGAEDEIRQVFPHASDITRLKEDLEQAKAIPDAGRILQIERELKQIERKHIQSPRHLTADKQQQLAGIDNAIETAVTPKEKKKFWAQRNALLKPEIEKLYQGDDKRETTLSELISIQKNTLKAALPGIFTSLPQPVRESVRYPVALFYSGGDALSDEPTARARRSAWKFDEYKKRRGQRTNGMDLYFPNAPLVLEAETPYLSHVAAVTDPEAYMSIILDLITRMRAYNKQSERLPTFEKRHY